MNRDVLTTGDVARMLNVSQHKVIDLCKTGLLKSWTVPGSSHRRIMRADLEELARRFNVPLNGDVK